MDDHDALAKKLVGKAISIVAKAGASDEAIGALAVEYPAFVRGALAEITPTTEIDLHTLVEASVKATLENLPDKHVPGGQTLLSKRPPVRQHGEVKRLNAVVAGNRTTLRIPLDLYNKAAQAMPKPVLDSLIENFANEPLPQGYARTGWVSSRLAQYMTLAEANPQESAQVKH